jgi:hypothetical protein
MIVDTIEGDWARVHVWVPSEPGCENDLTRPVREDTAWVRFQRADKRLLAKNKIGPC